MAAASHNIDGAILTGLMVGFIILMTVLLVLAGGIGLSFLAASAIFRAMSHRQESRPTAPLSTAEAAGIE